MQSLKKTKRTRICKKKREYEKSISELLVLLLLFRITLVRLTRVSSCNSLLVLYEKNQTNKQTFTSMFARARVCDDDDDYGSFCL